MATNTTNLGLIKPAGTDKVRIAQINQNMDIIDEKIGQVGNTSLQAQVAALGSGLAIVSNGNTHVAITSGQYVYIRNHSSLSEGLYKATAAIAANVALTTSNVTKSSNGSANDLKSAIDSLNSQKVAYAVGNDTIANIQSALVTLAGSMADGEIKKVRCNITVATGIFRITAYIGELMRISSSRLCVDLRESVDANEAVIGNYKDGTWHWAELATKEQIAGRITNQIVLPDSVVSCVITGAGNWQYCSLLYLGLVNGKGATLMSINTTGSTVEKTHLGGVDCTSVLNASFSGTSFTLSVSSSSNSFRGLVIASQGIMSAT